MAKFQIRYLVAKNGPKGPDGKPLYTRHYWQPDKKLREHGFGTLRLADDEITAIAEAETKNAELDAWRAGDDAPKKAPRRQSGTVRDLIARYMASPKWQRLAPSSRSNYAIMFDHIERMLGDQYVPSLHTGGLEAVLGAFAQVNPGTVKQVRAVLRLLLGRAKALYAPGEPGYTTHNPAEGLTLPPIASEYMPVLWPRQAVDHLVATADAMGLPAIGDAVRLNEWLGQRTADVLLLRRSVLDAGAFVFGQRKTRAAVHLPFAKVPALQARVDDALARQAARGRTGDTNVQATTIIADDTGAPWTPSAFRHHFAKVRGEAARTQPSFPAGYVVLGGDGVEEIAEIETAALRFGHLRHTAITRMSEAELTPQAIATISGHAISTVNTILDRYLIRTTKLAETAFATRLEHEKRTD